MTDWHFTPYTGLMRLHLRSRSLPRESPPPHLYTPTNTIYDSCFHPLLFLSPYLQDILGVLN